MANTSRYRGVAVGLLVVLPLAWALTGVSPAGAAGGPSGTQTTTGVTSPTQAASGITAAAAASGADSCPAKNFCLWGENSYTGAWWSSPSSNSNLAGSRWYSPYGAYSPDNGANSVANRGASCDVRVYENASYGGASMLFSHPSTGQYQDPQLSNGGPGSTSNWQDRISSYRFC